MGAQRPIALVGIEDHAAIIPPGTPSRSPFSDIEIRRSPEVYISPPMAAFEKTHNDFVEHVVETMREFGPVTAKSMFGGWGLYRDGLFFAIVFEDMLYLKVDEENCAPFEKANLPPFVYVTKDGERMTLSYRQAPPEALETRSAMAEWARLGYEAAVRAKNRKPARRRKPVQS